MYRKDIYAICQKKKIFIINLLNEISKKISSFVIYYVTNQKKFLNF